MFGTAGPHGDPVHRSRAAAVVTGNPHLLHRLAGGGRLYRQGLDDQRSFGRGKAEPRSMRRGEHRHDTVGRTVGHDQRRIGTGIAQMQRMPHLDALRLHALRPQGLARFLRQPRRQRLQHRHSIGRERHLDGLLAH
jgi:hypothetical protein